MHAQLLCQKYFDKTPTTFHGSRKTALRVITSSLLSEADLTLTSLGRHLPGEAYVKHKIKRVDRFLGNRHVYHALPLMYQELLRPLLLSLERLVVAVDWSGCCTPDYHVLRASVLYQGRSIPLYNTVVPEPFHEAEEVHERFLHDLHKLIPSDTAVIIVTDGGFRTPWFAAVRALGWDYIGRVRGHIHCQLPDEAWQDVQGLHARAGYTPRYLGKGLLGKTSDTQCATYFFIIKQRPQGRQKTKPLYPDAEQRYALLQTEPWVIVTSLEGGQKRARTLINLYEKRMQIEQNFRDDKNLRWGFAWRYSRTRDAARISVLCLIATLATLLLWLVGFAAEQAQLHRQFQANTEKHKRVLSYLFPGKQVLFHCPERISHSGWPGFIDVFIAHYQRQPELIWLH
jgi:hypothetical protein